MTWIPGSYIPGFGSSYQEEADRALSCTRRKPDSIQTQPLQQNPKFSEPCEATTEDSLSHQVPSGSGCQQTSLGFEFVYPEYCQIIPEREACVVGEHIPNVEGKYCHRKSQAQMEQSAEDNGVCSSGSWELSHAAFKSFPDTLT